MQQFDPTQFLNQTRSNYDRISWFYDFLSGNPEKHLIQDLISKLKLTQPGRIIEIGCGTGNGLLALRRKYPATTISGFDLSYRMCLKANTKTIKLTTKAPILISQADGLNLPVPSACAACIFISFTFELFPDHLQASLLNEIKRILDPKGKIAILTMYKTSSQSLISRLYAMAHENLPRVIDCRPVDAPAIFLKSGFEIVHQETYSIWGLPVVALVAQIKST